MNALFLITLSLILSGCGTRSDISKDGSCESKKHLDWLNNVVCHELGQLKLKNSKGETMAFSPSLFNDDTVPKSEPILLGGVLTKRFQTFESPSGNTLCAFESSGDADAVHQLVVFSRIKHSGKWSVKRFLPPRKMCGSLYVDCLPISITDDYLFYQYSKGGRKRIRWNDLMDYKE